MADIIPPGFAEVTIGIRHTAMTREANVVYGVATLAGGGDADEFAQEMQDIFVGTFGQQIDSQCVIANSRVVIGQDGTEGVVGFASTSSNGGAGRDSTAPILAARIQKRTARPGRRGRGNMFLPWALSDTNVNETGQLATAAINALNAAGSNFLSALAGAAYADGMYLLHSAGNTPPGDPDPINALTCNGTVSHQIRRQR